MSIYPGVFGRLRSNCLSAVLAGLTLLVNGCSSAPRVDYLKLWDKLEGKSIGAQERAGATTLPEADALMPRAYQFANPAGRPYHDDWELRGIPKAIQPWGKIRRMDTSFILPMPPKVVWSRGDPKPECVPYQEGWPLSPGAELRDTPGGRTPRCLVVYHPVLAAGQAAVFAVWLDGQWVNAFYTVTRNVLGFRIHSNRGLKHDVTLYDYMYNAPEFSLTFKKLPPDQAWHRPCPEPGASSPEACRAPPDLAITTPEDAFHSYRVLESR